MREELMAKYPEIHFQLKHNEKLKPWIASNPSITPLEFGSHYKDKKEILWGIRNSRNSLHIILCRKEKTSTRVVSTISTGLAFFPEVIRSMMENTAKRCLREYCTQLSGMDRVNALPHSGTLTQFFPAENLRQLVSKSSSGFRLFYKPVVW